MKNLIKVILLLLISLPTFGQEKTLKQVDESNNYRYTTYHSNGDVHQTGWFIRIDGKFIRNGIWEDSNGTKVSYDNGKLSWIKPANKPMYTYKDLKIKRLQRKVEKLEQLVATMD